MLHSLLVITVPFALFPSSSTPHEFKHVNSLAQATRIFTSSSLLQLALTSGLPADRIHLLEGENVGHTSYDQLISSARKNGIPRLPVRHATKDTLAYLVYSSGTSGPPKGMCLLLPLVSFSNRRNMNTPSDYIVQPSWYPMEISLLSPSQQW